MVIAPPPNPVTQVQRMEFRNQTSGIAIDPFHLRSGGAAGYSGDYWYWRTASPDGYHRKYMMLAANFQPPRIRPPSLKTTVFVRKKDSGLADGTYS